MHCPINSASQGVQDGLFISFDTAIRQKNSIFGTQPISLWHAAASLHMSSTTQLRQNAAIALGPALFGLILLAGPPTGMAHMAHMTLAATAWIITWWVTEAVPIAVTALLPMILFPLLGIADMEVITQPYAQPIIYLFLGGFLLAMAMERWQLHRRIALHVIALVGTDQHRIVLGFVAATGMLSMWLSNTATTVMMLPIALSLISEFRRDGEVDGRDPFPKALILSIPYAASIGGMATLVGTPTNLIFAQSVKDYYSIDVAFDQWMWVGLPVSVVLLLATWWHLTRVAFPLRNSVSMIERQRIRQQLLVLGPIRREEVMVMLIFGAVALSWMVRRYWINPYFPSVDDTLIALAGAVLLFLVPGRSDAGRRVRLLDWDHTRQLPWGTLLLFGGAFAVAKAFEESGLTAWIGSHLQGLAGWPYWLTLLIVVALVNFTTEITQNMATCTLMMPLLAGMAKAVDAHPIGLMAAAGMAASCAFMLPVATAPNAVVFGTGVIRMQDMVRAGFVLNLISIVVVATAVYILIPICWGMPLTGFPF